MSSTREMRSSLFYALQIAAALLGLLLSIYLLVQHTRLKVGIQEGVSICDGGKRFNCDAVDASPYSEVLGIPLAAFGAIFYFSLLLLSLLGKPGSKPFNRLQTLGGRLAGLGLLLDCYLLWVQIGILKTLCLYCCATYIAAGTFYLTVALLRREGNAPLSRFFISPLKPLSGPKIPLSTWAMGLILVGIFCVVIAMLPSFVQQEAQKGAQADFAKSYFEAWPEMPRLEIPIAPDDPKVGSPDAPVTIVEFSDFQCPFCKRAAEHLNQAKETFGDKLLIVFKHYPLDAECNDSVSKSSHPLACRLARLAYCANQKGQFWEYHDLVFFSDVGGGSWEVAQQKLKPIFSPPEIRACLSDPRSLAKVKRDIQQGNQLRLRGTPSTYINGKFLGPPATLNTLRRIFALETRK